MGLLALGAIGALGAVTFIVFASIRLSPGADDQIKVTSRDGPLRVGKGTLVVELLDWAGEPLFLDVTLRCEALRIEGPATYRDPGFYDVPVTALREGPATLVIDGRWNERRRRMTTSVPIVVLPAN